MGEFGKGELPKEIKEESEDEKPLPTKITKGEDIRQEILGNITFGNEKIAEVLIPENDWTDYLDFCENNNNVPDQMSGVPIRSSTEVKTLTFIKDADNKDQ
jgi:hypothetical protein